MAGMIAKSARVQETVTKTLYCGTVSWAKLSWRKMKMTEEAFCMRVRARARMREYVRVEPEREREREREKERERVSR